MMHQNKPTGIVAAILSLFLATTAYAQSDTTSLQCQDTKNPHLKLAVAVIENRFIAKGAIIDVKRNSKGIQKFCLRVNAVSSFMNYPNFGGSYVDKTVEVFSEIGIPSSFLVGIDVAVLLRVSGDERGQTLFLVEVF